MEATFELLTGAKGAANSLHEEWGDETVAYDDQSGAQLNPTMMREARRAEIEYFKSMNVYSKVPIAECWRETGCAPISTRWVDINKGDSMCPNYRSRRVAREFNTGSEKPEWYAATPPSETLRLMLSNLAGDRKSKLMYADVSRVYFYAPAVRTVYVRLPDEKFVLPQRIGRPSTAARCLQPVTLKARRALASSTMSRATRR